MTAPLMPEYEKVPEQPYSRLLGFRSLDGTLHLLPSPQAPVTMEHAAQHWQQARQARNRYVQQQRQTRQSTPPSQTAHRTPQPVIDIPPTPPQTFALAAQLQHDRLHGHTPTVTSSPPAYRQPIVWATCRTCGRTERDCRCLPTPSPNCFARVVEEQRKQGLIA